MRSLHRLAELSLADLKLVAAGQLSFPVSDREFLDVLASHACMVVSPWIVRLSPTGKLQNVTPLVFDEDGNIDKTRVLIHVARVLKKPRRPAAPRPGQGLLDFGPRFTPRDTPPAGN